MKPTTSITSKWNDRAACIGVDPLYFDLEACYPDALEICEPCPVKLWCLRTVDPASSHYDGVVGGQVWQNGRPVQGQTTLDRNILMAYLTWAKQRLTYVHPRTRDRDEIDEVAVGLAMDGRLPYTALNRAERQESAVRLARRGTPLVEIEALLHVSSRYIKRRLETPPTT